MTAHTKRFTDALDSARIAHAAQFRKGLNIPCLYHLLGVASLVIKPGHCAWLKHRNKFGNQSATFKSTMTAL